MKIKNGSNILLGILIFLTVFLPFFLSKNVFDLSANAVSFYGFLSFFGFFCKNSTAKNSENF